jgi:hypothetical protein
MKISSDRQSGRLIEVALFQLNKRMLARTCYKLDDWETIPIVPL